MATKTNCQFCNNKFNLKKLIEHENCIIEHCQGKSGYLLFFNAIGITNKDYYMYVIVGSNTKFSNINKFLKDIWCDCCGHTSIFKNCQTGYKIQTNRLLSEFDEDDEFVYEYDAGDTTTIFFRIVKKIKNNNDNKFSIIIRNEQPIIKCKKCKDNSNYYVCGDPICSKCIEKIDEDEKECKLEIVNSPRSGQCGYE